MKRIKFTALLLAFTLVPVAVRGQVDPTLSELAAIVEELRRDNLGPEDYGSAVSKMYNVGGGKKVTLLDDIRSDESAEYRGTDMNRFRLNSVVAIADTLQSGVNLSKSNYYDSRRKGVYYSLIEKSIKAGGTADFTITEHKGHQEIVVLPYDRTAQIEIDVKCDGRKVDKAIESGRYVFVVEDVAADDAIHVYITNGSTSFQSFAILNYNRKK